MSTLSSPSRTDVEGLADLLQRLGNVPLERIRIRRPLGMATEQELIEYMERTGRICELVDGVIVEKAMGYYESRLALVLGRFLDEFVEGPDLGIILGADGMIRVEGQVRLPDVSFFAWSHFSNHLLPRAQILGMAPDFAVEVLSPSNTEAEMERKRREYFFGGTKLVWEVFPDTRTVHVYTDPATFIEKGENDTLDGGAALPGFTLSIRRWFERAGQRGAP
jgi:Uma2 family endonuclease